MPPIEYITTCLAPNAQGKICGQQFKGSPVPIIVGQSGPPPELIKKAQALSQHLNKHHPQFVMSVSFSNLLLMFDSQDPEISKWRESARRQIHASTQKLRFDDTNLENGVKALGLDDVAELRVLELVKGLRDAYEELGQFAPQQVEQSPIAVAR